MKKKWLIAGALGILAAVLYFVSVANYTFPGDGAHLMACWQGLDTMTVPRYPLMSVFAKMLGAGNAIAPICGVVSVLLLFVLVSRFVSWRILDEEARRHRESTSCIAGAVAAAVFMLSPAVRSAATHLEPRLFDFTWLLLSFSLSIPFFARTFRPAWLFPILLGVMVAFGLTDSALFLAVLPFYLALVWRVARANHRRPYLPILLFAGTAFITLLIAFKLFDLPMVDCFRSVKGELQGYRRTPGWWFVTIFTTVPFVTALFSSGKAFGEKSGPVQWMFHSAMSFVAILAVATPLSPSALMETYGILPVATSAFAASVAGYLIGYWWINRRALVGCVVGGVLSFVLLVSVVWNLFSFDGDSGSFADKVARKIIDDLGERRWFVTDGTLDDHLRIEAAKAGRQLRIVSLARDDDKAYMADLAELVRKEGVGGSKNGELQLSLSLGVLAFLKDWFAADPTVGKDVAIFGAPDIWYASDKTPVPEFFFFGADEKRVPDWSKWKEFDAILAVPSEWGSFVSRKTTNPVDRLRYSLRRHLGFVANNRGVYLLDQKRDDEAFAMYELVLNEIDRDNICAIFNEVEMAGKKHAGAIARQRELERMLKMAMEDKSRRYILNRLGTYYGYIRNPDILIKLGYAWARSARPGEALAQLRRAIDLVPTDRRSVLLNMMASLYASRNEQGRSREIYESLLRKNAKDHDALIGMMRLELMNGNSSKALEYLKRAAKSGKGKQADIELAMVAMMQNDLEKAKSLVKKVTDADPKDMQAWSMLAAVTMQQIDAAKDMKTSAALLKELEHVVLPAMEKHASSQFDYYLQMTKSFVLLRQGEKGRESARDAIAIAVKSRPDIVSAQNMLLGLDIALNDKTNALAHAKDALRRDRNMPRANYVMGSIALGEGRYAEAELYLRKAADAPQPDPLALNDLAEVFRRTKNYPEAERYARKATKAAPGLYVVWETLGSVLMDAKADLSEAEAAIRRACELSKDKTTGKESDVRMLISLARVQLKNKDRDRARLTIRKVLSRIDELSEFELKEFEEVRKLAR